MLRRTLVIILAIAAGLAAQQKVPFANGIPVAPKGLAGKKLPAAPVTYPTAEGETIRVVVATRGLEFPWSLAFLPDGTTLVTERSGKLRAVRKGVLDPVPVAGAPVAYGTGESGMPGAVHGMMDIALHPDFARNQLVYMTYTKKLAGDKLALGVARGKWNGKVLEGTADVFVYETQASTGRLAFGRDGMLYVSTSGNDPQDPKTLGGKILRLRDDGSPAPGNPFVAQGGRPEVYTIGHRNTLALTMHPGTGEMWQSENGPNGGDEVNILKAGANYGWPLVSLGRAYPGPWQDGKSATQAGFEGPVVYWTPAIAASGLMFYTGDKFPKWKGDVFVGSLRTGEIPGTGHLDRILFNEKMEELRRESLLTDLRQRIREVKQGPDGLIYLLTDEKDGAILRIEPASK
jgi:glucose/arabinose dehydrogenase